MPRKTITLVCAHCGTSFAGSADRRFCSVFCSTRIGRHRTHGASRNGSPEYRLWMNIRARCRNPKNPSYQYYGGRGITVDPAWNSFAVFLADVGPRPSPADSLDRIDNDGNYEPGNVRWITRQAQMSNTRRNVHLTFEGRTQTLTEWARELGMKAITLWNRIFTRGWSVEDALTVRLWERPRHRGDARDPKTGRFI